MARSAARRAEGGSAAEELGHTRGVPVELEDDGRLRAELGLAQDAVAGPVEAVGVGLEPVAQRDAGHAEPARRVVEQARQQLELLFVERLEMLGGDRAEEDGTPRRPAERKVGVAERDPPGRHVPTGVADVQFGEQHARLRRMASGRRRPPRLHVFDDRTREL
jgi:hypothetical protein